MSKELATASDQRQFVSTRIEAASKLDTASRAKLRSKLVSSLPGEWDKATLDTIEVLGVVGDNDTAEYLKTLEHQPSEVPGKINAAIKRAIKSIEGHPN